MFEFLLKFFLYYLSFLLIGMPVAIILTSANTISEKKDGGFSNCAKVCLALSIIVGIIIFCATPTIG